MSIEALKRALEALQVARDQVVDPEYAPIGWSVSLFDEVIEATKQALAAPVQEPVESKWSDAGELKRLKKGDVVRVFRKGQEYYRAFKFYGSIEECDYTYDGNKPFAWLEVGTATLDKIVYTRKDFVTGAVYADRGDVVEILQPVNKETPAAQPAPVQEPVYLVEDDFGLFRITNKGDYTYWSSTGRHKTFIANATPPAQPPCPTCEALARTVMLDQTSHDQFKPDWDAMAVMVEEQQRMAKRIEDLEAMLERQTARIVDLQTHIENFDGEDR